MSSIKVADRYMFSTTSGYSIYISASSCFLLSCNCLPFLDNECATVHNAVIILLFFDVFPWLILQLQTLVLLFALYQDWILRLQTLPILYTVFYFVFVFFFTAVFAGTHIVLQGVSLPPNILFLIFAYLGLLLRPHTRWSWAQLFKANDVVS